MMLGIKVTSFRELLIVL